MNDTHPRDARSLLDALMDQWRTAVKTMFETKDATHPAALNLYREDVHFTDPLRTFRGRAVLAEYNAGFLKKAQAVEITFGDTASGDRVAFAAWTMFVTPKVGPRMRVDGVSRLVIEAGQIIEQEDTFDVTRLLPVVGPSLRALVRLVGS